MYFWPHISQTNIIEANFRINEMTIKMEMLRCFSTVVQTGNLAEAAVRLSRTQSALSMSLKQLEEHLGQRLFETDRKNRLTPLGTQVFELAQQQLRDYDNTIRAIETTASSPKGLIRIVSVPSVSGLVFPSAIDQLNNLYPGIKVELRDTDTQQVINALIQNHADIGIASGHHALNGIQQHLLFEDRFGLVCSPNNPLARQVDDPHISEVVSSGFVRNELCELIDCSEFQEIMSSALVTVHNTMSLIGMVRTANWVTVLPQQVVHLLPSDLSFRPIAGLTAKRPVYALLREHSQFPGYAMDLFNIVCKFDWKEQIVKLG